MERRKYPRVLMQFPIMMAFVQTQTGGEGQLINLSRGGAAIRSDTSVTKGDFLTLRIYPTEGETPIVVETAVVMWVQGQDFGVEFLKVPAAEEERLRNLLGPFLDSSGHVPDTEKGH